MKRKIKDTNADLLNENWIHTHEGQLSVDVAETPEEVIIRAAIGGIKPEDLDIFLSHDTVTIKGTRMHEEKEDIHTTYHYRECHWGGFSRTIILPSHVNADESSAKLKNSVLTIRLKKLSSTNIHLSIEDDDL